MVTERQNRGQLVLITAITIAFILLAIVIVFNGLLFTQTVASEDASKATTDVKVAENELERGIQGVVIRSNLEGEEDWEAHVESYLLEYRNVSGATKPAIVQVSDYDQDHGQWANDEILAEGEMVLIGTDTVGHLVIEVPGQGGVPVVEDPEGDALEIRVKEDIGCEAERFDLMSGSAVDTDGNLVADGCEFETIEPSTEYISINIDNELEAPIEYTLVVKEIGLLDPITDSSEVPWSVSITYTYDSSDVTATRTIEIENVYEDAEHVWPEGTSP